MSKLEELIQQHCPDGVEYKKLGDLGTFENIGVDKKTIEGQPLVSLLNYVDVYKNIYIDNNVPQMVVSATPKKIKDCTCEKGDIFLTPTSETRDDIGHASVITETLVNTVYSYHIMRFRLTETNNMITSFFIRYLFETELVQKQIYKLAKGLTRFGLSKYDFEKIEIPYPPIEVQEEIVRILDDFTNLTAELQAELQARQQQYEYYRDKLLSFSNLSNRGGWNVSVEWKKLGDVCTVFTGGEVPDNSIKGNEPQGDMVYPIWGNGKDVYGFAATYQIDQDAVCVSSIGANTGAIFYHKAFFTPIIRLKVLIPKDDTLSARYLFHTLSVIGFDVKKSSVPNMNANEVKQKSIPIPPLAEQQRIVDILDRFDKLTTDITEGIPAEIEARRKQYEYYRDKLLTFKQKV